MINLSWDLLDDLCRIHAVSGREDAIITYIQQLIEPLVDDLWVDNLGNVVGMLTGSSYPDYRLMLQAHMDELGLIVRNITDDGFILVERVGGIPEKSLLGQKMDILTDGGDLVTGYVGAKSHHITRPDEKYVVPKVHQMYLDIGAQNSEGVQKLGIQVGDPITYHPNFHRFGDGQICSKALDNRVSVFILLEILKELSKNRPPSTMVFAFTVLEEFSIRGSLPAVTATKPDAIISMDITIATDTPSADDLHPVKLRGGPAIKMMDFHGRGTLGGMFSSPKFRRYIEGRAKAAEIPLQREVIVGVITDPAFQLYLGDRGFIIAGLSIPHRYSHSSISMCHELDIEQTAALIYEITTDFSPQVDLSRGE